MAQKSSQPRASPKKGKTKVNFGANGSSRKRKSSPAAESESEASSAKKSRTDGASGTTSAGSSTSAGTANPSGAGSANTSGSAAGTAGNNTAAETVPAKKRVRNPWGIHPKEVPANAKMTQRAFQRFIRGLCGLLTQTDVLPSALEAQKHYDRRFYDVEDYGAQMRNLVNESRTAVTAAKDLATKLGRDAKRIPEPIANDIAHIPELHLATVFTMIFKTGLKGFCPDLEGPVQSTYNQIHRHLAVSGFQFLSASFALSALEVNMKVAENTELLGDMHDNYTYGTLAQKTKIERRRPGSLGQSLKHGIEYKARESHSDDEDGRVREKPGRNPVVARFFLKELDPAAEVYRKCNAKPGQKAPKPRIRSNPLLPTSDIGVILPPDVPIDFFTPEFYNALTLKERPMEHEDWKTMGKKEFMLMYGNDEVEIDLEDTDDDDEEEMDVDAELNGEE
ncbi:hypothetical protein FB451DRAFT_1404170 [Mycena latifolia]|nr:hypothetical protein FB451DRAFT_1404170 [Mycena latifolia]